jgi:hypothetical protein
MASALSGDDPVTVALSRQFSGRLTGATGEGIAQSADVTRQIGCQKGSEFV